jgi:hypothetical protein
MLISRQKQREKKYKDTDTLLYKYEIRFLMNVAIYVYIVWDMTGNSGTVLIARKYETNRRHHYACHVYPINGMQLVFTS